MIFGRLSYNTPAEAEITQTIEKLLTARTGLVTE
jgi:hypothetical protein